MTHQIQYLPIDQIIPTKDNPRKIKKNDPAIKEMSENIKIHGVIQPVIVRPINGHYDLRAGERRWTAADKAGLTEIPCIVREMDDREAMEITVSENFHREDLTPLEEAEGFQKLIDIGWTLDQISEHRGKPVTFVAKRANLLKLSEDWKKLISNPDKAVSLWSVSHLELIARFPENIQNDLIDILSANDDIGYSDTYSIHEIRSEISAYLKSIELAPFDIKDTELVPEVGACTTCTFRSDHQKTLFDELDMMDDKQRHDYKVAKNDKERNAVVKKIKPTTLCLNHPCWEKKILQYTINKEKELRNEYGADLRIITEENGSNQYFEKAEPKYHYNEFKKRKSKHTVPCLIVDGHNAGKLMHGVPNSLAKQSSNGKTEPKTLEQKQAEWDNKRKKWVIKRVIEQLNTWESTGEHFLSKLSARDLLPVTIVHGLDIPYQFNHELRETIDFKRNDWEYTRELDRKSEDEIKAILVKILLAIFQANLKGGLSGYGSEHTFPMVENIAQWTGIDLEGIKDQAMKANPYPKSWEIEE